MYFFQNYFSPVQTNQWFTIASKVIPRLAKRDQLALREPLPPRNWSPSVIYHFRLYFHPSATTDLLNRHCFWASRRVLYILYLLCIPHPNHRFLLKISSHLQLTDFSGPSLMIWGKEGSHDTTVWSQKYLSSSLFWYFFTSFLSYSFCDPLTRHFLNFSRHTDCHGNWASSFHTTGWDPISNKHPNKMFFFSFHGPQVEC